MKSKTIEITELEKDIFRIREIFYKECANLYLLIGNKKNLLIDTGIGIIDIRDAIRKISLYPVTVVNTHSHFDHCGGNKFFDEVCVHESEKEFIENPDKMKTASFLLKKSDFACSVKGFDPEEYAVCPVKKPIPLKNNQSMTIGDFRLKILHMPGHSPGSICLYDPHKKILFSGDVVYRGEMYNLPYSNPKAHLLSLKKVSRIDVKKCFPGHNEIFDSNDFQSAVKSSAEALIIGTRKGDVFERS